jgi:hypothetical protein
MDDKLHPARFVEEALQNDGILRRQAAECGSGSGKIFDQLVGGRLPDADLPG